MMVFWTAGFVLLTLLINAPLLPTVLRLTGLSTVSFFEEGGGDGQQEGFLQALQYNLTVTVTVNYCYCHCYCYICYCDIYANPSLVHPAVILCVAAPYALSALSRTTSCLASSQLLQLTVNTYRHVSHCQGHPAVVSDVCCRTMHPRRPSRLPPCMYISPRCLRSSLLAGGVLLQRWQITAAMFWRS